MRYLLIIILFAITESLLAQMPRDGNYSNWNWEDQSQNNWQRELGAGEPDNDGITDGWTNIKPPFSPLSLRVGEIIDVFATQDYTRAKGWKLMWAHFHSIHPYFILYNEHKAIIRVFFYLDGGETFTHLLANLSYHDTNNPGILAGGNDGVAATDKYLSGEENGKNDQLSVIIPNVGVQSWCSADFPVFLDNNIQDSRYSNKKWVFLFYGADNYAIKLAGTNTNPPGYESQHSISGGIVSSRQFSAQHGKFHSQLKTTSDFLVQMQNSTKRINSSSPEFLQNYKSTVNNLSSVAQIFSTAVGISSGVGAVLGFFNLVNGSFDDQNSTAPQAIIQYLDLEGSMDVKSTLGGSTIKIPGVNGSVFPPVKWNPYNCPVGYFNMKKTPTMNVVKPYNRYGCPPQNNYAGGDHHSGYSGKYKKYKMDDDIELVINEIEGMDLIDVHFAIVCKPTGQGNRAYSIKDKYISEYKLYNYSGQTIETSVINPVYDQLENNQFIIHKFDEENDEIVFGTPYIPMNQFKGVTFELPEDTDVKIRVVAKFTSIYYDKPIVFQADYKFNIIEEEYDKSGAGLFCNKEQTNFLFEDYFLGQSYLGLENKTYTGTHRAETVELLPGFIGIPDFLAEGISGADAYPNNGNTIIERIDYNCQNTLSSINLAKLHNHQTAVQNINSYQPIDYNHSETINIYPNPSSGIIQIESMFEQPLKQIQVFDLNGRMIDEKNVESNRTEFNISEEPAGVYILNMIYEDKVIIRRVVKQ